MGGEKSNKTKDAKAIAGSPPRGRGKAFVVIWFLDNSRITPAWAGKSNFFVHPPKRGRITPAWAGKRAGPLRAPSWSRDHPRVGGEKTPVLSPRDSWKGSPPRGRGKGPPGSGSGKQRGITPAWAGKS